MHGRKSHGMIAWKDALGGEQGVKEVAAFVLSLSGREVNANDAAAGKAKFAFCVACHGSEGKGSAEMGIALGAPNLTDNVWLYGGSQRAVEASIAKGRAGVMPAWDKILGEKKVHLILSLIHI